MKSYLSCAFLISSFTMLVLGCNRIEETARSDVPTQPPLQLATITPAFPSALIETASINATPVVADLKFSDIPTDLGGLHWPDGDKKQEVYFNALGIYAIDKNTALLYGGVGLPGRTLLSTILRTNDGGYHWTEVMQPAPGSDVMMLSFVEEGLGWALVSWTVEGPGNIQLYRTKDYGLTWHKLADVPKSVWYGRPLEMKFSDAKHGQINVLYDGGLPETNRVEFLTTSDGGLYWQETGNYSLKATPGHALATARADYLIKHPVPDLHSSATQDGSLWQFDGDWRASYITLTRELQKAGDKILINPSCYPR